MARGARCLTACVWIAAVSLCACGNSGSGGPGGGGASGCQTACARCGGDLCLDCAATSARLRDEFETDLYACVGQGADASCGTLWQSCAIQAEGRITRRPSDDAYRDACLAKRTTCMAEGTSIADDDCLLSPILEASVVMQAQACLALACPEAKSCLQPIFD